MFRCLRGHRVYVLDKHGKRHITRVWGLRPARLHAQTQSFRQDVLYAVVDGQWYQSGKRLAWAGTAVDGIQHAGVEPGVS